MFCVLDNVQGQYCGDLRCKHASASIDVSDVPSWAMSETHRYLYCAMPLWGRRVNASNPKGLYEQVHARRVLVSGEQR